jgi:hypothetical protein
VAALEFGGLEKQRSGLTEWLTHSS